MRTGCEAVKLFCPSRASTTRVYIPAGTGSPLGSRADQLRFTCPFHAPESTRKLAWPPPPPPPPPAPPWIHPGGDAAREGARNPPLPPTIAGLARRVHAVP